MTSDEIRRTFLEYFEQQRPPEAAVGDRWCRPSMTRPRCSRSPGCTRSSRTSPALKRRRAPRVTTCQKVFRTPDIEIIGTTTRHLTFFEMLGNFSFGDYFKREATRFAWELSTQGFGFTPDDIWITVFAGDEELGLGPDEEAIQAWMDIGVPRERIVECPRSENFWQAGPTGPCGPVLRAVPRPGSGLRQVRRSARRRERALPGVLEPGVHGDGPEPHQRAHPAAGQEHRHRPGPQPDGGHPPGQGDGV